MTHPSHSALPETASAPGVEEVFAFGDEQIRQAVRELWPGESIDLCHHVPSVTGYVRQVRVGDRPLFAKVSFLGVSMVSLLRGVCGGMPQIRQAQEGYVTGPDGLLQREAGQLRMLAALGSPRVCALAGMARGVLFTEPVPGRSLAELLKARPADTADLLELPFRELYELHQPHAVRRLESAEVIGERAISGTFARKFNGISGALYVKLLGADRCPVEDHEQLVDEMRQVVARLHRLRFSALLKTARPVLAYGEVKPEHVVFPGGVAGRPVFLDPGLMRSGATADMAKLISRTALLVAAEQPGPQSARQITEGIGAFVERRLQSVSREVRGSWLRELLVLWLMDTTNITTTYWSAPPGLPLPAHGLALVERARQVCRLLDMVSTDLAAGKRPFDVWEHALDHVQAVAA